MPATGRFVTGSERRLASSPTPTLTARPTSGPTRPIRSSSQSCAPIARRPPPPWPLSRAPRRDLRNQSAAASGPASRPSLADLRTAVAKLDAEIQRLDAQIHERLTWKFESSADQFKHDTTAKLVADLTAFVDPDPKKGLLADVRGRLAFAESVERRRSASTRRSGRTRSSRSPTRASAPKYDGLEIKPQLGLIPIGKDPASGLWEFAHLQTTAPGTDPIPKRDEDGQLVVTEVDGHRVRADPGRHVQDGRGQARRGPSADGAERRSRGARRRISGHRGPRSTRSSCRSTR